MSLWGWLWDKATDVGHAVTGIPTADQRRNQQYAMNDQIKAYKEQTEMNKQEMARKKNEAVAEKRRVEEKQIRSLRGNLRSRGLLGDSAPAQPGMNAKLGG